MMKTICAVERSLIAESSCITASIFQLYIDWLDPLGLTALNKYQRNRKWLHSSWWIPDGAFLMVNGEFLMVHGEFLMVHSWWWMVNSWWCIPESPNMVSDRWYAVGPCAKTRRIYSFSRSEPGWAGYAYTVRPPSASLSRMRERRGSTFDPQAICRVGSGDETNVRGHRTRKLGHWASTEARSLWAVTVLCHTCRPVHWSGARTSLVRETTQAGLPSLSRNKRRGNCFLSYLFRSIAAERERRPSFWSS